MITNADQYQKAQEELRQLEERLQRLQQSHPLGTKGFTKAGIRKMIARLHDELAVYEGSQESIRLTPRSGTPCRCNRSAELFAPPDRVPRRVSGSR